MSSKSYYFFTSIVQPTVEEFLADTGNIRRAKLAAIVLNHMADYVALESNESLSNLHKKIIDKCPNFSIIKDVADATKHAQLYKNSKREISSSEQITSTPGLFQAPFGEGVFAEAVTVFVKLNNEINKPLEPAIRSVMLMWESSQNK